MKKGSNVTEAYVCLVLEIKKISHNLCSLIFTIQKLQNSALVVALIQLPHVWLSGMKLNTFRRVHVKPPLSTIERRKDVSKE